MKQIKLLYVEDEDVNWEVTHLHLHSRYDMTRASTAEEAFGVLRKERFHAILMDIQLANSKLDGIGITRILRGKEIPAKIPPFAQGLVLPAVPIIFLTAYSARYPRDELLSYGGDELVTKPIDFTQLALCLSRCLLKTVNQSVSTLR